MCKKDGKFKATALSAEITFGSWGRALWVTAANAAYENGKDDKGNTKYYETIVTDVHQSWGGAAPRTGLAIAGNSDNVGFKLDIHSNATGIGQGGNAYIWVKPIDSLRVSVGKHDDNFLRSDAAYGLWNWDRLGCVDGVGEGFIFDNYLDKTTGVNAHFTPNEALSVGFHIPLDLEGNHSADAVTKDNGEAESDPYVTGSLTDAWLNSAIVLGYKIENVGTAKAGLKLNNGTTTEKDIAKDLLGEARVAELEKAGTSFGVSKIYNRDKDGKDVKTWVEIAAAFELTAVENLYAALGVVIPTINTKPIKANVYGKYNVNEQLAVHAIVGTKINEFDAKEYGKKATKDLYNGFGFLAGAGVDYALDGGIGLFADVRYANGVYCGKNSDSEAKADHFTLGLGATKGFSNGLIGVAFEGSTNKGGRYNLKPNDKGAQDKFSWEIPVKFEYCF